LELSRSSPIAEIGSAEGLKHPIRRIIFLTIQRHIPIHQRTCPQKVLSPFIEDLAAGRDCDQTQPQKNRFDAGTDGVRMNTKLRSESSETASSISCSMKNQEVSSMSFFEPKSVDSL